MRFIILPLVLLMSSLFGGASNDLVQEARCYVEHNREIENPKELLSMLDEIEEKGFYLEQGDDNLRVKFVILQGILENVMREGQRVGMLHDLEGIFHTPAPPTPLCTPVDPLDLTLLDASIRDDEKKQYTVHLRTIVLRQLLEEGGTLHCYYPRGGLEKRSVIQQDVFLGECARYPENLKHHLLDLTKLDEDFIGALYRFADSVGNEHIFSIKARQANDPKDLSEWGIWFGPTSNPSIETRLSQITQYLDRYLD